MTDRTASRPRLAPVSTMERIAMFCFDRRRLVGGGWVALLIGLSVIGTVFGGEFRTSFSLPGSESQDAIDLLNEANFGDRTGLQSQIVFKSESGVNNAEIQAAMEQFFTRIEGAVENVSVVSPYSEEGARQVSQDGTIAYAELNFEDRIFEEYMTAAEEIIAIEKDVEVSGLDVELGGDIFAAQEMPASELLGIIGAMIILLIAFGSLLAMGMPIIAALFGIGTGFALVNLTMNIVDMPNFTTPVAAMIGLGVGIDYALFIVTRYRNALHNGMEPREAVVLALNTAGRAVLFAGITVVISLFGLVFMGLDMIRGLAIGASLAVLMTMFASITLVPALLGFAGRNIDRFGLPHGKRAQVDDPNSFWHRWSHMIQRYPWPFAIGGFLFLAILTIPVFSMRLGFSDAGNRPESDTSRRAYDLLGQGFGPGFNGPMLVAAETPRGDEDRAVLAKISETLNSTPGITFASPVISNEDGTAAIVQVIPATSPQDEETAALVHDLRDTIIPGIVGSEPTDVLLGGVTPGAQDFADFTGDRLPIFFAGVLTLSFLLLMIVFRSVLVPLKAMVMNLLSIGAAYGILVAVFQWGWGINLVGVGKEGPIDAWVPMMLFAIVFGLSMDYEVFLLSRIREEYDRTGNNATAVADGLAATARVITAAAAIMCLVFASFILGHDRALKLAGLGLATAVLLDATIVRMILVPATMELLGDRNWWMPKWLDRILPRVHVEAPAAASGAKVPGGVPGQ